MKLIGICGFIGGGKDTVAEMLVKKDFIKESFARGVKDAVSAIFSWDRDLLEGSTQGSREWREKPDVYWSHRFGKDFSPRQALQLMGTEVGRSVYHPNLWVDALERRMNPTKNYVISDVRFPNEIRWISKLGGRVIRVKRGSDPVWFDEAVKTNIMNHTPSMATFPGAPHYSEWAWCGDMFIAETIDNNGTLEDLENAVDLIIKNTDPANF